MRNPKFINKQEYLQYRKDWKEEYKELSITIRELKIDIRDGQRENLPVGIMQYNLMKYRKDARNMMEELKYAKIEANRQYLMSLKPEILS